MFLPFVIYMTIFITMALGSTGEFLDKDNGLTNETFADDEIKLQRHMLMLACIVCWCLWGYFIRVELKQIA